MKTTTKVVLAAVMLLAAATTTTSPAGAASGAPQACTTWVTSGTAYHVPIRVGELHMGSYTTGQFSYLDESQTTIEAALSVNGVWGSSSGSYSVGSSSSTSYTSLVKPAGYDYAYFADFIFQDYKATCSVNGVSKAYVEARPQRWAGGMTESPITYSQPWLKPDCSVTYPTYTTPAGPGTYRRSSGTAFTNSAGASVHGVSLTVKTVQSTSNWVEYKVSRASELCGTNGFFSSASGALISSNA